MEFSPAKNNPLYSTSPFLRNSPLPLRTILNEALASSSNTVKPPIKDTLKEDKPPNKGQAKNTHVYTLYRKSPLKEDNLSTKDKTAEVPLYTVKYLVFFLD